MDYKVGDKVKVKSDLIGGKFYNAVYFGTSMVKFCGKEYTISEYRNDRNIILEWNDFDYDRKRSNEMLEPVDIKPVVKRPKYEWYAIDDQWNKFEKNAIWDRSLEEIKKQIQERKELNSRDESLLRSHRNLFGKKSCK